VTTIEFGAFTNESALYSVDLNNNPLAVGKIEILSLIPKVERVKLTRNESDTAKHVVVGERTFQSSYGFWILQS